MVWDEENRLRGINDNGKLHLYTYDHTGERALKSSGESSTVVTNGLTSAVITHMDDYTAYVNPYFVVQKGRFTKHYFEGSSRIVSKLGEGTFVHKNTGIMAGGIDYIRQSAQMQEARDRYIKGSLTPPGPPTQHGIYASPEWTGQPYPSLGWQNIRQDQEPPEGWPRPPKFNEPGNVPGPPVQYGDPITPQTVKAGYGFVPNGIREKNLYFYHPDHLGSSSYITDREGRITQHTEYIAFGEVLFEEHSTSRTMPYLFNGKELDTETGLYYYGARYYDPRVSLWLNVDPLAEKTMTPYAYTNNNPIMLVDPTGMASESYGPGPKGSWGGVKWLKYINNWHYEDGVEFYRTNIRAREGILKSINGRAFINVKQTIGQWDKEYGFLPVDRTNKINANIKEVTNCYGYVLTGGYFFVDDTMDNISNFLNNSGYKSSQPNNNTSFKVGDILLWDGHMIEATETKNGKIMWESYFGFDDNPIKGGLKEVMNYNKTYGKAYGSLKNAELYRQEDKSKIKFQEKKYDPINVQKAQQQKEKSFTSN